MAFSDPRGGVCHEKNHVHRLTTARDDSTIRLTPGHSLDRLTNKQRTKHMSKISRDAATAFRAGHDFKRTNTLVFTDHHGESNLLLWGNRIAWTSDGRKTLNVNQCGWDTSTTNTRLRALGVAIEHRRTKLYINGRPAIDTGTYSMAL